MVCHNDGNYKNNRPNNLRADTQKNNISDKVKHGTAQIGSKHPNAKITEEQALALRAALSGRRKKGDIKRIAAEHGISLHIAYEFTKSNASVWRHL